jgi:hypothetical protein
MVLPALPSISGPSGTRVEFDVLGHQVAAELCVGDDVRAVLAAAFGLGAGQAPLEVTGDALVAGEWCIVERVQVEAIALAVVLRA